jgi:hypothetical protein
MVTVEGRRQQSEGRSGMQVLKVTFGRLAVVAAATVFLVIEAAPRVKY